MKNFKAHILIVDDDDGIRNLLKKYLDFKKRKKRSSFNLAIEVC